MNLAKEIQRVTSFVMYTSLRLYKSTSLCCFQSPQSGMGEFLGCIQKFRGMHCVLRDLELQENLTQCFKAVRHLLVTAHMMR